MDFICSLHNLLRSLLFILHFCLPLAPNPPPQKSTQSLFIMSCLLSGLAINEVSLNHFCHVFQLLSEPLRIFSHWFPFWFSAFLWRIPHLSPIKWIKPCGMEDGSWGLVGQGNFHCELEGGREAATGWARRLGLGPKGYWYCALVREMWGRRIVTSLLGMWERHWNWMRYWN